MTALSIGLPGATDLGMLRRLAPRIEAAGYRALWLNDTPGGDSLAALAAVAEVTATLGLATGVIPLDRTPAAEIARRATELGLPQGRLRIGVGSGGRRQGGLALLEQGIAELHDVLAAPVLVGALGPRTRALAARMADGILFSWLTPAVATDAMRDLRAAGTGEGVLYARTIANPAAREARDAETARYAGYPQYAAHFAREGIDPAATTIDLSRPEAVEEYRAVDELVLRAITASGSEEELVEVIEAGAVTDR